MAKHKYDFKLPGALHLRVESPLPLLDSVAAQLLLAAYLPGVEKLPEEAEPAKNTASLTRITVRLLQLDHQSLVAKSGNCGGTYTLSAPFDGNPESALMDLIFLCYGAARQQWLRQGLYPVHAACLEDSAGRLHLLAGHSGVGKTAVTLSLVGRGQKVYSGNKTLVKIEDGAIVAVAGTYTITTKAEDLERHLPQHRPAQGYQGRSAFTLPVACYSSLLDEELNQTKEAKAKATAIGKIVLPRLNDGSEKCQKLSALSALHKLYPYFLDAVNGDIVLLGGAVVLSGDPSRAVKERLSQALSFTLSQTPTYELQGSIGYVIQRLEEL